MSVPKLRFPEFNDEWEQNVLSDISDVRDGTHDSPKYVEKGYPLLTSKNLNKNGTLNYDNVSFVSKEDFDKINQRSKVEDNDILFGMIGTIGNPVKVKKPNFAIKNVALIKESDLLSNDYLIHYLRSAPIAKQFYNENKGGTQKFIALGNIRALIIRKPTNSLEERKIINFLSNLDKKIQLQEEKIDLLKEQKNGFMQKIFSQELRFKDEDGQNFPQWKKLKLSDFAERVTRKNSNLQTNKPLTISAQYGLIDQIEFFNKNVASENLTGYYLLENGEFAYNKSYSNGFPLGTIKRLDRYENGALSTLYICFKLNEKVDSDFLVHYFDSSSWHKEVSLICVEGARNHGLLNVSVSEFFDTEHFIPSYKEQIKIAEFLNVVNTNIKLNEQKLDKLQQQKQAFMQQMFI